MRTRLPPELAVKVSDNLMKYQLNKKHFADALDTFSSMNNIKEKQITDESLQEVVAAIWDLINKHSEIESEEQLKVQNIWNRKIHRRQISLNFMEGMAQSAALYCQNGFHQFDSTKVATFSQSTPKEFGKCSLLLQSEQSVTFSFKERGDMMFTKPSDLLSNLNVQL